MRHVVLDRYVQRRRIDDGRLHDGRMLHFEERFDRLDFGLVCVVGQRAPFGRQSAGRHPFGVLFLLQTRRFITRQYSNCNLTDLAAMTYALASYTHLGHAVRTGHLQFNAELVLRNVHVGRHFAALQADTVHGWRAGLGVLRRFVHPQIQVSAREPIPFERFQREFFWPV